MEFTLRYRGPLKSGAGRVAEKHAIRCALHTQLADYWARDPRLTVVRLHELKPPIKTRRHRYDVRPEDSKVGDETTWFYALSINEIKFVPLVMAWRFLRCELAIRLYRYEGDEYRGRLLEGNGDLDNQLKTLLDALRMPQSRDEVPKDCTHGDPVFFCLLEDDRLITKLALETKQLLGPRPTGRDLHNVDVELDVRVLPIKPMPLNAEMLYP